MYIYMQKCYKKVGALEGIQTAWGSWELSGTYSMY